MSKETKELKDLNKKNVAKKSTVAKKATTNKKIEEKKATSTKKTTTKKTTTAKNTTAKKATAKKATNKTTTKKESVKKITKKVATKKATTKKRTTKKSKANIVEYYDLPYRYNQTIVKLLAQTPTSLFVYWDISDEDRKKYQENYGEYFFYDTHPVLVVHNDTLGYSFEVEINDFANSWYLHVDDSRCDYRIELGRRPNHKNEYVKEDYYYVTTSNEIEAPNDKILLDPNQKMIYFRNVKTGEQYEKPFKSLSFIQNMGKIYDIYDVYKQLYHTEEIETIYDKSNPSS